MAMNQGASSDELDALDMAQLADGHDAALDALMDRHGERLFRYLVRHLRDDSDAADLAQETFVRIFQHRKKFDLRKKFSTWMYAIATNLVRDRFRWRARHPHVSLDAEILTTERDYHHAILDPTPVPSQAAQTAERSQAVRDAVGALPEKLRTPLLLAEFEDRSHAEIAAILKCTAKAVEMRLYRARTQLRERLANAVR